MDIPKLTSRLQQLQTNVAVLTSMREDAAKKAHKGLSSLAPEDIEALTPIVPMLPIVARYTVDDIMKNANGEVDNINTVVYALSKYLDGRLSHFEEQL